MPISDVDCKEYGVIATNKMQVLENQSSFKNFKVSLDLEKHGSWIHTIGLFDYACLPWNVWNAHLGAIMH